MSKKDNFSQAMFEMFGLGKSPEDGEEINEAGESSESTSFGNSTASEPVAAPAAEPAEPEIDIPLVEEASAQPVQPAQPVQSAQPVQPFARAEAPTPVSDTFAAQAAAHREALHRTKTSYFAEGTSLEGTLRCDSDLELCGDFKGEIISQGKVTLHANTSSNVSAMELTLIDCTLIGNSAVSGDVSLNAKSTINGNISAANLFCSGVINGNLTIGGNITLTENAQIIGDIATGTLSISRGARVTGKIDMGGMNIVG